jgi:hypothetical protein
MFIDAFAEDPCEELEAQKATLTPGHRQYLLIDGVFVPGLHRLLRNDAKALLFESLPSCSDQTRDVSPFLTPFETENKALRSLLERCNRWPMVSVIETPETLDQLAKRLAAWCIVEVDKQRFNFRFSDTRRQPAIIGALSKQQRAQFAGPAVRWSYLNRAARWRSIDICPSNAEIAQNPVLDELQFGRLIDDGRPDELLSVLSYRGTDVYRSPSRSYSLITTALDAASRAVLNDGELVEWCESFCKQDRIHSDSEASLAFDAWLNTFREET